MFKTKILPENFECLFFPVITLMRVVLILMTLKYFDFEALIQGKGRYWYGHCPDLWIFEPLIFLCLNIFFVFLESSFIGFLAVLGSAAWLIFSKMTFPLMMHVLLKP